MESRKLILLAFALLVAGGTAFMAKNAMKAQAPQHEAPVVVEKPVVQEILAAVRDLPAGTILKDVDIKWAPLPAGQTVAEDQISKDKADMKSYVGGVVRKGVRAEMPLTTDRVVQKGDKGFMAAVLNPGMRAISVSVTPVAGVGGFLFPGDHVDVILTHQLNRKSEAQQGGHKVSETLLRNVRVLALDQRSDDQAAEPKVAQVATLEVTSKQAETMALVTEIGTISLALCSQQPDPSQPPSLTDAAPVTNMTWDSDISQVLEKPANRKGMTQRIQVMRGKETTESVFDLQQ